MTHVQKFWATISITLLFSLVMAIGIVNTNNHWFWALYLALAIGGSIAATRAIED